MVKTQQRRRKWFGISAGRCWLLYAMSAVRDPNDRVGLTFLAVFWPLLELILSWWWVAASTKQYADSKYLAQGNTFALTASMLAPILGYVFITSHIESITVLSMVMIGVSLVGHWAARLLWLTRKTISE